MFVRPRISMFLRCAVLALIAFALTAPTLAADELGIFWDEPLYMQVQTEASAPTVLTGYLVLKDCSSASGVLGWECKILQDGPGTFVDWALEGQSINVGTFPEFQVGIGGDPLPLTGNGVLLATFQFYYDQNQPVRFGLTNIYKDSIDGEMSYIPADDPDVLRVMSPLGNPDEVAAINGNIPSPIIEPAGLNFGEVAVGSLGLNHVRITNGGGGTLMVDASVAADCPQFTLLDYAGPYYLGRHQSVMLHVQFAPTELGQVTCDLELGPQIPNIPLGGIGREPVTSFVVTPADLDFGAVAITQSRTLQLNLRNTGETDIPLVPVIVDSVPGLYISEYPPADVLSPGMAWGMEVTFAPEAVGAIAATLDLGPVLPDVPINGSGRELLTLWDLDPEHVVFIDVDPGVEHNRRLTIHNVGDTAIPLEPSLATDDGLFRIYPFDSTVLQPGLSQGYTIFFRSDLPGNFTNYLNMGDVIPPVLIVANVPFGEEPCLVTPPELDFGEITVGETYTLEFSITNQQAAPMDVAPQDYTSGLVVLGEPTVLDFGETATYWARITPYGEGQLDGIITLGGDYCGDLPWTALAVEPSCLAGPTPLDFGVVAVNQVHTMPLAVKNPYTSPITLTPVSDDPAVTITEATVTLAPGEIRSLEVLFAPTQVGPHAATIDLGTGECEPIGVLGTAAVPECQVALDILDFGTVIIGQAAQRYVDVVNTGTASIVITPTTSGPAFSADGPGGSLAPGQSRTIAVTFRPIIQGSVQGTLDFGLDTCPPVTLVGEGDTPIIVGDNLIGIYFDTSPYVDYDFLVSPGIVEPVTCYLVLKDSSDPAGVSAWECAFSIQGNAIDAGWLLEGNAVNVGGPGEFIVGLAQPLPWSPGVLLATGTIISTLGTNESALLQLRPIQTPSLEGEMGWIGGSNPNLILPMHTVTGEPTVAIIATSIATPVEMPAPLASQTGGRVKLSWTLHGDVGDGCHVYRRGPDGLDERLTVQPVAASGNRFEYVDQPFGFPANATLTYSYAKVVGGVEGPRSAETEVRFTGVPAMVTRLLANVPNPFNPSTAVHFEMQKPGRVRVAVYAMDGRLVRTLVDDSLAAGPHHRVWDGRDDGGRQVSSGAYYLRLETAESVDHRKMMLLK